MGIGEAYLGLIKLFSDDRIGGAVLDATDYVFGFVGENPLRALKGDDQERIKAWYEKSSVYVSAKHGVWDKEVKLKKRHGRVVRSKEAELQDMLFFHRDKVTGKMEELTEGWEEEVALKKGVRAKELVGGDSGVALVGLGDGGGGGGASGRKDDADDELGDGLVRSVVVPTGPGDVLSASGVINGSLNRRAADVSLEDGGVAKKARNGL